MVDHAPCPVFPGKAVRIHRSFEDPPHPGATDPEAMMSIFRRVLDEIRDWLRADFIPRVSGVRS